MATLFPKSALQRKMWRFGIPISIRSQGSLTPFGLRRFFRDSARTAFGQSFQTATLARFYRLNVESSATDGA
jgi:hypothetical protein